MEKNKYGYLIKNTFLFTISSFCSKLLTFFLVPLYTSVLSTSDYGTADLLTTTAYLLLYIVTVNIADAVLRFVIEKQNYGEEIYGYAIKVILKGNILYLLLLIIFAYFNPIHWEYYLYVFLFLNVFLTSFQNLASNYLRAKDNVRDVAIGGIVSTAITILCNIVTLVVFKLGLIGYLISLNLGLLVTTVFYLFKCENIYHAFLNATKNRDIQKSMMRYCIPLILNGIAWWISASLDKYFVVAMINTSANGIYSVAQKIPSILTTFSTIFMQAWNLSAIKEFDKNDSDGFFTNTYKTVNSALVICCSFLILINIPLAKVLYNKDFFIAWKCSSWLLISVVFSSLSSFEGSVFSAVKNTRIVSVSTVMSAIINIVLNFIFIPIWGIQGAAIATAISFFSVWLIRYILMKKYIKIRTNNYLCLSTYLLLIVQVLLERIYNHCYIGQCVIFIIIIFLYKKNLKAIIVKIKSTIKKH